MADAPRSISYEPMWLDSDDGDRILLASDAQQAQAEVDDWYGPREYRAEPHGWMENVGWDRLNYERKRDFVEESGFTSWWEGFNASHDAHEETKKRRRAWEAVPA